MIPLGIVRLPKAVNNTCPIDATHRHSFAEGNAVLWENWRTLQMYNQRMICTTILAMVLACYGTYGHISTSRGMKIPMGFHFQTDQKFQQKKRQIHLKIISWHTAGMNLSLLSGWFSSIRVIQNAKCLSLICKPEFLASAQPATWEFTFFMKKKCHHQSGPHLCHFCYSMLPTLLSSCAFFN